PQVQRPLIRSTTHAPDQPTCRPRLLHWTFDLPAPGHGECGKGATDFHDLSRAPPDAQVELGTTPVHTCVFGKLRLPAWEIGLHLIIKDIPVKCVHRNLSN